MSRGRAPLAALALLLALAAGSWGCGSDAAVREPASVVAGAGPGSGGSGSGDSGGAAALGGGAGASGNAFDPSGHGLPGAEPGTWTYLVYMLADNNLEAYALQDLEALMQVGSTGKLTILTQVDRALGESELPIGGLPSFTGAKRVRVEPGRLLELETLGEVNQGASGALSDFLAWGIQAAPADHYALVLWDHGGAFGRFGVDASGDNDGLDLTELTRAVDLSIAATGLRGPLDLIGFDACLLGTWEVAVALEGRAHYLLGSEEVEPGHGWDHRAISLLTEGADARALGSALIAGYAAQAREQGTSARTTLALTDLRRVPAVSERMGELTRQLSGTIEGSARLIGQSRAAVGTFGSVPRGASANMIDLQSWADQLGQRDPELQPSIAALRSALDAAVVEQTQGDAYQGVGGLSVYFPPVERLYEAGYDELARVDVWRDFLADFYAAAEALGTPPSFNDPNARASVSSRDGGVSVTGTLAAGSYGNLASTSLDFGVFALDGRALFLGEQAAKVSADGIVNAVWNREVLRLSQNGRSDYASYVVEHSSPEIDTLSIPLQYSDGGQVSTVVLMLAVDAERSVLSQTYYSSVDGAWAEIVPAPDSSFVTLVPTLLPGASELDIVPQSTVFDARTPVVVEPARLSSTSDVFVRLRATDYAGQWAFVDNSRRF
jgi:cysteine peptidase C11 family protein